MMKKYLYIHTLFLIIFLVTGCSRKELKIPLEDIGMVDSIAIDYIDENQIKLTVAIPQYSPEAKESTQTFSKTTTLLSNGIVEIEKEADKKIVLNQLRVILLNEDFALKGEVRRIIEILYRHNEVANKVLIAVVKDSAEDILKGNYPEFPRTNFYLNNLLEPSINTAFNPNTNIHDFMYMLTNPVFDPILPYIEKLDGKLNIKGVALFKEENMIELITPEEALIIQALKGKKNLAPLQLDLDTDYGEEKLIIDLVESSIQKKGNKNMTQPTLTIFLKIKGKLSEYRGGRENQLSSIEEINHLEKDINKEIEKDMEIFIERMNNLEIDPSGLSEEFRMYNHGKWTVNKKKEVLSKLDFEVHVDTSIISTGTLK